MEGLHIEVKAIEIWIRAKVDSWQNKSVQSERRAPFLGEGERGLELGGLPAFYSKQSTTKSHTTL